MKIKRSTKITSETQREFIAVLRRSPVILLCRICKTEVEMFSINQAADRLQSPWRNIVRLIEDGTLHPAEAAVGSVYVCSRSVYRRADSGSDTISSSTGGASVSEKFHIQKKEK